MRASTEKGDTQRRFAKHYAARGTDGLRLDHPALLEARTIFKSRVIDPQYAPRLLVSGQNNSKIGRKVTVGRWKGFPIFTLTLEERATCPRTCRQWGTCYGNSMHLSRRHRHGPELELFLAIELAVLQSKHPKGFVVRLHVLGDFYSVGYVNKWAVWLDMFPALHVFGYTARLPVTDIGGAIYRLASQQWERFAIRWSMPASSFDATMQRRALVVKPNEELPSGAFACPAQSKHEKCCANCGACWQSNKSVAFREHGNTFKKRSAVPAEEVERIAA